jgi:hypothetical protein
MFITGFSDSDYGNCIDSRRSVALIDLRYPETLMALSCDNRSAIDLAENYWISELSKHIDIHHHRDRE